MAKSKIIAGLKDAVRHARGGVWCVKGRNAVWCAVEGNRDPGEGPTNVWTACGDCIVMPYGIERRQPTCETCKE